MPCHMQAMAALGSQCAAAQAHQNSAALRALASQRAEALRASILGHLLSRFERVFVVCFADNCAPHRPGGGLWSAEMQQRVVVFDGAVYDKRYPS